METKDPKSSRRMTGAALRLAARLMETPGTRGVLYQVARKQMGLDRLDVEEIPPHLAPYQPLHLCGAADEEGEP